FFNGSTTTQSVNFGYGLATTGVNGTGELGSLVPGMEQQVNAFIADHQQVNQTADADALYVLWGGSNDYFLPDADPEQTVANLEAQIESLHDLGGENFLVVNLPDLGLLPEANNPNLPVSAEGLSELATAHNSLLDSRVKVLQDSLTGLDIDILDANTLFTDIVSDPEAFGLTNVTEPFLDPLTFTPTVGADVDEYLFFDTLHPTQAAYEFLSDLALETIGQETAL
ncbi:MAG: SGNH/GDSL hydrolase family protein, partial [Cyanobacteria bacterium J06600_6]